MATKMGLNSEAKGKMISARFLLEAGADIKKTDNSANKM